MTAAPDALVFVYNANEGVAAMVIDGLHKLLRPDTYSCDLCAITYGAVAMRGAWRRWLDAQRFATEFYHRQDFCRAYPGLAGVPLPAIFRRDGSVMTLMLGPDDMHADMPVEALVDAIDRALA